MYATGNPKTKKEFKRIALNKSAINHIFNNSAIFDVSIPENGHVFVEGPAPVHKWYSKVTIKNGIITRIE